jgi:hypothetical protein
VKTIKKLRTRLSSVVTFPKGDFHWRKDERKKRNHLTSLLSHGPFRNQAPQIITGSTVNNSDHFQDVTDNDRDNNGRDNPENHSSLAKHHSSHYQLHQWRPTQNYEEPDSFEYEDSSYASANVDTDSDLESLDCSGGPRSDAGRRTNNAAAKVLGVKGKKASRGKKSVARPHRIVDSADEGELASDESAMNIGKKMSRKKTMQTERRQERSYLGLPATKPNMQAPFRTASQCHDMSGLVLLWPKVDFLINRSLRAG